MTTQYGDYATYQHQHQPQPTAAQAYTPVVPHFNDQNGLPDWTSISGPAQPLGAPTQSPTPQSRKRRTSDSEQDEVESQSHMSKHFKKLRLDRTTPHVLQPRGVGYHAGAFRGSHDHLYPRTHPSPRLQAQSSGQTYSTVDTNPHNPLYEHHNAPYQLPTGGPDLEWMPLDDTPNRVVIRDLDAEIAAIEAEEAANAAMLLPGVDKNFDIHNLLNGNSNQSRQAYGHDVMAGPSTPSQALILYREPCSITIPESEDAVRKAVIEARKRLRQRAVEQVQQVEAQEQDDIMRLREDERGQGFIPMGDGEEDLDDDAMDIG